MKGEFYKMEYEAWDEGTDDISLELEGAYLRLCHQMYRRRGAVPESIPTLARIWRCHPNKARKLFDELLAAGKIEKTPEGIVNDRVRQELDHRGITSTSRSDAGKKGGTRSGDVRRKSLKTNASDEAFASSETKPNPQRREEKSRAQQLTAVEGNVVQARTRADLDEIERKLREASKTEQDPSPGLFDLSAIVGLLDAGYRLEEDILASIRTKCASGFRPRRWTYFVPGIQDARGVREKSSSVPAQQQEAPEITWRRMLDSWKRGTWVAAWGPSPDMAGCEIPPEFIKKWEADAA